MPKISKRSQFLIDISDLIDSAASQGIYLICFEFDRSQAEQEAYVLSGKSWTRRSKHLRWQAMDLAIVEEDGKVDFSNDHTEDYKKYELLGQYWESKGKDHVWGAGKLKNGKRRDVYHFELR